MDLAVPGLEKRPGSGKHEIRAANGDEQQRKYAPYRRIGPDGFPGVVKHNRQEKQGADKQEQMDASLETTDLPADEPMRIPIPDKQPNLKKQHTGRPNRRAASEPGKDMLAC